MKKLVTYGAVLLCLLLGYYQQRTTGAATPQNNGNAVEQISHVEQTGNGDNTAVEQAIEQRRSDVQLTAWGAVKKALADDNQGSRHQRFLVELPSGHTLLVAHNIDLAERVADLQPGELIELHGEYVWNERGGVMHWTHHDPSGRHAAGWIKYKGRVYQ
jgi:hypothetical protein